MISYKNRHHAICSKPDQTNLVNKGFRMQHEEQCKITSMCKQHGPRWMVFTIHSQFQRIWLNKQIFKFLQNNLKFKSQVSSKELPYGIYKFTCFLDKYTKKIMKILTVCSCSCFTCYWPIWKLKTLLLCK